ncbi:hypothetical protein [Arthrobacter sp. ZBG10]|uniref:hypothetical protein n=1 Tax=Arthrobacter sp. ZBG10 TaxID=1676590 RepID=UPI001E530C81|nr:hypothetical protein [Arthrobacter sp. ZBG10]
MMKFTAPLTLGATALLALVVSGCSSPAAAPADGASASGGPASGGSSAAAASDPAKTEEAKEYTAADLAGILEQLEDTAGNKLQILPVTDVETTLAQTKELISSIEVEPAECKQLAAGGTVPDAEGLALAAGQSTDAATGGVVALSLVSGQDQAFLEKAMSQGADLKNCAEMTMTVQGTAVAVKIEVLDGVGTSPDTVAYRTDTTVPGGTVQSVVTAMVAKNGVLVSSVATGGATEADAAERAGALLDSAAALIK